MLTFWERTELLRREIVIVGGGLLGLWTALALRELAPARGVTVLERGLLPRGASTRNAGFACFGSLSEILADFATMGEEAALRLIELRWRGLCRLRSTIPAAAIEYVQRGGYELLAARLLGALDHIERVNALVAPIVGDQAFFDASDRLDDFGFSRAHTAALIANPLEGELHSGKLLRALQTRCRELGVEIITGAEVTAIDDDGSDANALALIVKSDERVLRLHAQQTVVCVNGAMSELVPGLDIAPARGQVLMTAPIAALPWRGCFHMNEGFDYFRAVEAEDGARVLIGGGRNIAREEETTNSPNLNEKLQARLEMLLRDTVLPGLAFRVESRWAGIMGFRPDQQPLVRWVSPRSLAAFACNGMGVSITPEVGWRAAAVLEARWT